MQPFSIKNTRSTWAGKYKGILRTAVMSGMFYIYDVVRRVCIYQRIITELSPLLCFRGRCLGCVREVFKGIQDNVSTTVLSYLLRAQLQRVLLERDLHVLHSVQHVVLTDTARYKGNRALPKASRMYMVVCIRWGVSLIKTSNYLRTRKGTDGQTDRQTINPCWSGVT